MKWILRFVVVIGLGLIGFLVAYEINLYKPRAETRPFVIRGGMLFDGTGTPARPNPGIVVEKGLITCIGGDCVAPAGASAIDASGLSLVPGLIDLHVHFLMVNPDTDDDQASVRAILGLSAIWDAIRMKPGARMALHRAGVTTLRSVGDPQSSIFDIKQYLLDGYIEGPRLFVAGPLLTAPGGHPVNRIPSGWMSSEIAIQLSQPEAARAAVSDLAARGADGIKAVFHGVKRDDGKVILPRLDEGVFSALCDEARLRGLWVAVHSGGTNAEVMTATKCGATTIEHGVRHGNLIGDDTIDLLSQNEVVYVPTLGHEPKGHLNIPALFQAGVMLGVGTDGDSHLEYHNELKRLSDAGVPAADVLLAATRNGARALRMEDRLGTLETGKVADIVIVSGEPWKRIDDLSNVAMVFQAGRLVVRQGQLVD